MSLHPEAVPPVPGWRRWIGAHAAGLTALALGLIAVGVAAILAFGGDQVDRIPDPRVTGPLLVLTLAATVAAFVRREGTYALALTGVGAAGCAMVLGWAMVVAVIAAVTAVIIVILSEIL